MKKFITTAGACIIAGCLCACTINMNFNSQGTKSGDTIDEPLAQDPVKSSEDISNDDNVDVSNVDDEEAKAKEARLNEISEIIESIKSENEFDDYEKLYAYVASVDNILEIEGTWNRTKVHNGLCSKVVISNVTQEGFDFDVEACYFSNMGMMTENAKFVTESCAVCRYEDFSVQYIMFLFEDDLINIYPTGNSADLGFGMNVSMDGTYTLEEPEYTNANVLHDMYTDEELESIKAFCSEEEYEKFLFVTENGNIESVQDSSGKKVTGWVPTLPDYSYEVIIVDGAVSSITFGDVYK